MKNFLQTVAIIFLLLPNDIAAQPNGEGLPVFQFYDSNGKSHSFQETLDAMSKYDVILFGELHDHALIHWLELKVAERLAERRALMVGGEMFETDNQLLLKEYATGLVNDKRFEAEAKLWPNYETDYKPLVQFAKANGGAFIGTNIPRRYAALVSGSGLDTLQSLSAEARSYMAPLPIAFSMEVPGYTEMMEMMHGGGMGMNFDPSNFVKAQAIKDATMAHSIIQNLPDGHCFLHFNGDYHSADFGGIYWHLLQQKPTLKVCTIKVSDREEIQFDPELKGSGTFILVVPGDFTRTY